MGREIERTQFAPGDFARYATRLREETQLLEEWLRAGRMEQTGHVAGCELEAWLLDRNFFPVAENERFLTRLDDPLVVPELSKFNVELNVTPQRLAGQGLRMMEDELAVTWRRCLDVARDLESTLIMIGTLPTVRRQDLTLSNISKRNRYYALNEQVLKVRGGRPLRLEISGRDRLELTQLDVMMEAAATSFQLHLQTPAAEIARFYNASMILSAPLLALAANSPFLFGKSLWDETRIPLFEQAVDTGDARHPELRRVTFGSGFIEDDPIAYFRENIEQYPILLPMHFQDGEQRLRHVRLHNGTIWRWNRLLIGFDDADTPSLRVEHRVMSSGPTIVDMVANAAVYFGAVYFLAGLRAAPEADISFATARENFYRAARDGLEARLIWLDGSEVSARELLTDEIVHMARQGLILLGVDRDEARRYLDLIRARLRTGQNGTAWQRAHAQKYGNDFFRLTADYLAHQRSEMPVHEWPV